MFKKSCDERKSKPKHQKKGSAPFFKISRHFSVSKATRETNVMPKLMLKTRKLGDVWFHVCSRKGRTKKAWLLVHALLRALQLPLSFGNWPFLRSHILTTLSMPADTSCSAESPNVTAVTWYVELRLEQGFFRRQSQIFTEQSSEAEATRGGPLLDCTGLTLFTKPVWPEMKRVPVKLKIFRLIGKSFFCVRNKDS